MAVDERTFASEVSKWIEAILRERPDLPYSEARVEEHLLGGKKRLDIKLLRRGEKRVVLTGEVKMPDKPYGRNHLDGELVGDAFEKASRLGSPYYFTWNVNRFALFETHRDNVPFNERTMGDFAVTNIADSDQVFREPTRSAIQGFLKDLLVRLARIERKEEVFPNLPLDRRFIVRLESSLEDPILLTQGALISRCQADNTFRTALDAWMREAHGWDISSAAENREVLLERAARLSCYSLVNRLVFYEVLRRRSSLQALGKLNYSSNAALEEGLADCFREAAAVSHDYETIFEASGLDSHVPFLAEKATEAWQRLIRNMEDFDFTRLDYDVIGRMYEELIAPAERKKYGQYYTAPDVVDLINAFCIRNPRAKVMDGACGGGTFLVRAYARKKGLAEARGEGVTHQQLISDLYGVDLHSFPVQLSTINLAIRHLADEANYPQVVREDFFSVKPGEAMVSLPAGADASGKRDVVPEALDALVGNPPYVRQEELGREYKDYLANLMAEEYRYSQQPNLSGRSDLYVYFFPHGGAFVKDSGYLGLVTSVGWLDTEYGFRLQGFLLKHFRIIAIIESQVEKWFEDARVTTIVTILQKEPDDMRRRSNLVRFVQLRRPLREIYSIALSDDTESTRQSDMDAIRDLIEEANENQTTTYWRIRAKRQGELWNEGCRVRLSGDDAGDESGNPAREGEYKAGKWGQYLRAPDVYFELLDRCQGRLVPLFEVAEVKRGFTSGADKFYCVRDVTEEQISRAGTPGEFRKRWAISVADTKTIRIIRDGEGGLHLVEARFLEPEFHRLTEATRTVVTAKDVKKLAINASASRAGLRRTHLARYIAYAEGKGWHTGATVASRAKVRLWYDLGLTSKEERPQVFWAKAHQYRHLAIWNQDRMPCNCRLYEVRTIPGTQQPEVLWAILNSTIVALIKQQFGRPQGIEGNLDTEVIDVKMMLVPDPRGIPEHIAERVVKAATALSERRIARMLPDEFGLADRQELDDAVLELLGISSPEERLELRGHIYSALEAEYETVRKRELTAQKDRLRSKRKGVVTVGDMAEEIWATEAPTLDLQEFPTDFISVRVDSVYNLPPGPVEVGKAMMDTGRHLRAGTIRVGGREGEILEIGSVAKGLYLACVANCGHSGQILLPSDEECREAVRAFDEYQSEFRERFRDLATERTRDARKQEAIVKALMRKALLWRREG